MCKVILYKFSIFNKSSRVISLLRWIHCVGENSVNPDRLAFDEASSSGSLLFS